MEETGETIIGAFFPLNMSFGIHNQKEVDEDQYEKRCP